MSREQVSKSSFKVFKADDSFDDEYEEDSDKDELTFISQKIRKMWQNKGSSKWKTPQEEYPKKRKIKTRAPYSTMNAKKPRHLKSECPVSYTHLTLPTN